MLCLSLRLGAIVVVPLVTAVNTAEPLMGSHQWLNLKGLAAVIAVAREGREALPNSIWGWDHHSHNSAPL